MKIDASELFLRFLKISKLRPILSGQHVDRWININQLVPSYFEKKICVFFYISGCKRHRLPNFAFGTYLIWLEKEIKVSDFFLSLFRISGKIRLTCLMPKSAKLDFFAIKKCSKLLDL